MMLPEERIYTARLMVVDDTPINVDMLMQVLEADGYEAVEGFTNPLEGLARCAVCPPDLLLLDIRMPQLDGFGFMQRLESLPVAVRPPVLVLTAQTDEETRRRALAAGARDFVTKPFLVWELLSRVRNTVEAHLLFRDTLDNALKLDALVRERTRELETARREIIRRLCAAGEFRDNDTGLHVVRIAQYSRMIVEKLGWPAERIDMLVEAAPLHDIGKIAIPDAILLKPGPLTDDERAIMQTHAEVGARILDASGYPLLDLAQIIALSHHERWDGRGYPNRLAGAAIPLEARIVAVADVFDALTTRRPYKAPWALTDALAFITGQAGQHFDPEIAALFVENPSAVGEIYARLMD